MRIVLRKKRGRERQESLIPFLLFTAVRGGRSSTLLSLHVYDTYVVVDVALCVVEFYNSNKTSAC
jgi:hypothetical protein